MKGSNKPKQYRILPQWQEASKEGWRLKVFQCTKTCYITTHETTYMYMKSLLSFVAFVCASLI